MEALRGFKQTVHLIELQYMGEEKLEGRRRSELCLTSLYTGAPEKRNSPSTFISCPDVAKCRRFATLVKKKSIEERNGHGVGNNDNTDKKTVKVWH